MSHRHHVIDRIAGIIRAQLGTESTNIHDVGDFFFQFLTDEDEGVHLELPSNEYLPDETQLSGDDMQILRDLGFTDPDEDWPNWYIRGEDRADVAGLALSVVDALTYVYRVPMDVIAMDLGVALIPSDPAREFTIETLEDDLVEVPSTLDSHYQAWVAARRRPVMYDSPWDSDVPAQFFAIVDEVDRSACIELLALAPAGPHDCRVVWYRRERLNWVVDPLVPRRLAHGWSSVLRHLSRELAAQVEPTMRFGGLPVVMPPKVA